MSQEIDQMARPRSVFLSVPQEMRDNIYECLFLTRTFVVKNPRTKETSSSLHLHPDTHLAILNVSRSTHKEAKRALYRHGDFLFSDLSLEWPPLLHEVIDKMPAITLLQHITLHVDVGALFYDELVFGETAMKFINCFADLGPGVGIPRKLCAVEIELFCGGAPRSFDPCGTATGLTDALGRFTGFQTVEVTVRYSSLQWRLRPGEEDMEPLHHALDETLTKKFGKVKKGSDKRCFCWIYHPHRE